MVSQQGCKTLTAELSDKLLCCWRFRQGWNSSQSEHSNAQQSLRLTLMTQLMACGVVSPYQAIDGMRAIHQSFSSRLSSHCMSPMIYHHWRTIKQHISGENFDGMHVTLLNAYWALHESKLLLHKGMNDAAIASLSRRVVDVV